VDEHQAAPIPKQRELRTPEDLPLPPNTVDELRRDMARLAMVCEQIKALEQARLANLEQAPGTGPPAMVRLIASVIGVGIDAGYGSAEMIGWPGGRARRTCGCSTSPSVGTAPFRAATSPSIQRATAMSAQAAKN
jgi:hypothetical protein